MRAPQTPAERSAIETYIQAEEAYGAAGDAREAAKRALTDVLPLGWTECGDNQVCIKRHSTAGGVLRFSVIVTEK
jgi:hypothetical protein